tara:strand:- start:3868 stop:4329 length:462 start_codon:yes stop_codon:yes gene_type:complete
VVEKLNLPSYEFKIKAEKEKLYIFDSIRKKMLVLTPEEWVRQNFIEFLHQEKGYPKSLMKQELGMKYNRMDKRSDIVCHNTEGVPLVLVECKRPQIKITQKTFDQIARYNMVLKVPFLAVTNGLEHYFCEIDHENKRYTFIPEIPPYEQLVNS